jgi:hypothetical protein
MPRLLPTRPTTSAGGKPLRGHAKAQNGRYRAQTANRARRQIELKPDHRLILLYSARRSNAAEIAMPRNAIGRCE